MSPLRRLVCAFVNSMDVFEHCTAANPAQDDVMTIRAAESLIRDRDALKEAVKDDMPTYFDMVTNEVSNVAS